MASEKTSPVTISPGVSRKAKTTSEKVAKFVVPVTPERASFTASQPRTQPRSPPSRARTIDSRTKETMIETRPKPRARRVAISRVRADTAAYIVFMAPKQAPIAMTTPTKRPRNLIGAAVEVWSS